MQRLIRRRLLINGFDKRSMKTISSKDAQNAFGHLLDTVQRELVVVLRRNRPVSVMLSMDNLPAIFELADSMRETIRAGC